MKITSMFQSRLIGYRLIKGLSTTKVAAFLKIPEKTLISWEKGKSEPSASELLSIAILYHVSVDVLLGLEGTIMKRETTANPLKENEISDTEKLLIGKYRMLSDVQKLIVSTTIDLYFEKDLQKQLEIQNTLSKLMKEIKD